MGKKIAVTGAASGIGRATVERLTADGHHVIGIDRAGTEVTADLSIPAGRASMVEELTRRSRGSLDGVVACAGVYAADDNGAAVVAVNYFGALATLEGLRFLLAASPAPAAVAVSSNAATVSPFISKTVADACVAGKETAALAAAKNPVAAYGATKWALARYVRAEAVSPRWIGERIRLNAVLPGLTRTPMTELIMDVFLDAGDDIHPMPAGRPGRPEEMAAAIRFLLSEEASYCVGSLLYADGGTDAVLRAGDWPTQRPRPEAV